MGEIWERLGGDAKQAVGKPAGAKEPSDYATLSDRPQPTVYKGPPADKPSGGLDAAMEGVKMMFGAAPQAPAAGAGVLPARSVANDDETFGPKRGTPMPMPGGYANGGGVNPALLVLQRVRGRGGAAPAGAGIGRYLEGPGDGRSDSFQAAVADGEYIIPADIVAAIGNGSSNAGARALDEMVGQKRGEFRDHLDNLPGPRR